MRFVKESPIGRLRRQMAIALDGAHTRFVVGDGYGVPGERA